MVDATINPLPPGALPVGVERKDSTVLTQGLNPVLMSFLVRLGLVHLHLFGAPVVITSGVDAKHAVNSKHYKGDAVDVRIMDKASYAQPCFLLVVCTLAKNFNLAVFDESQLPGAPHVHIEIAG